MEENQRLQWVFDRLFGIADGSLQRITIRELRKMIRIMLGNNSALRTVSEPNLNRYISTEGIQGISAQMIMPVNSLRERQNVRNRWINATRRAITYNNISDNNNSNNNTTSINSKKSNGTKLSTSTRKKLKKTPTTPQSKLKK
jgi:uncharacterized protein YcbX